MKRKGLIVLVFVIVALGSYFIYGNYFSDSSNKNGTQNLYNITYGNSSGNLVNGGYLVKQENYLYGDVNPSGQGLYRCSLKFKNLFRITDDQALDVNIDGQWIYYINYSDNMKLYKVNIEGGERTKLSNDKVDGLNYVNGILYYIDVTKKRTLYRMDSEGKNLRLVLKDINCMNLIVKDGWAYYINKGNIYRVSIDGKNKTKLVTTRITAYNSYDEWRGNFDVYGDSIYYPGLDGRLYKMTVDGKSSTVLVKGNVESINIYNGYLYYFSETTKSIYRIKLDSKPFPEYIFGGADYYNINIVSDEGVLFKDKSVSNGGLYMVLKDLGKNSK